MRKPIRQQSGTAAFRQDVQQADISELASFMTRPSNVITSASRLTCDSPKLMGWNKMTGRAYVGRHLKGGDFFQNEGFFPAA